MRLGLERIPGPHLAVVLWRAEGDRQPPAPAKFFPPYVPFTVWERITLFTLALDELPLRQQGRITARAMPRPSAAHSRVRDFLPPRYVRGVTTKDPAETLKDRWLGEAEDDFRVLDTSELDGPLTSTAIRAAIRAGAPWQDYMPARCRPYFASIDGPRRWLTIP